MEILSHNYLRDTAFWINVISVFISSAALTMNNYPSIPENIQNTLSLLSGATEVAGIAYYIVDMISHMPQDLRVLIIPELTQSWYLIRNRRFQTTLLITVNVLLQNRLSFIKSL